MIDPAAAQRVKLVVLDVDGVLTDGGYYLGDVAGGLSDALRFDIQDGVGLVLLRSAGIRVGIITGRESASVRTRAAQLKVDALVQDSSARKVPAIRRMASELGVSLDEIAFVGDDIPDLGVMRLVGMPVAVGNAVKDIMEVARVRLTKTGGHGAVREFAELLLTARGEWSERVEAYLSARSVEAVST